ncbi:MAG TPA: hypothetical protein DEA22_06615 [Blastocatellia bacterium]|nr:hypothetical protein [Blastocatellia bacterium]
MPLWVKAAGKWGGIFVIIALVIALLKQIIAFIGFITVFVKLMIFVAFLALIAFVGYLIIKNLNEKKARKE